MSLEQSLTNEPLPGPTSRWRRRWLWSTMLLVAVVLVGALASTYGQAAAKENEQRAMPKWNTPLACGRCAICGPAKPFRQDRWFTASEMVGEE